MGRFAAGQVVILPFPFSDLSGHKCRPALRLAEVGRGNWIACQITSKVYGDARAVPLDASDFETGGLRRQSYARPAKRFTVHESLLADSVGPLRQAVLERVRQDLIRILQGEIQESGYGG